MKRQTKILISVLAVGAVLAVGCLFWRQTQARTFAYHLKGTFLCGDQVSPSAQYFTFYEDGTYYWYRQRELLETGIFARREPGIFGLTPEGDDESYGEVLALGNGSLYRTEDGRMMAYEKISDTPALINVPDARKS